MQPGKKTERFPTSLAAQIENLRAWIMLMLLASVCRCLWVHANRHDLMGVVSLDEWSRFFWTGFRYDAMAVTYLLLPCFLVASLLVIAPSKRPILQRFRTIWVTFLYFAFPVLAFANIVYYHVYNNVFDEVMFEFFEGNAGDVIAIAYEEYGAIPKLILCGLLGAAFTFVYHKWLSGPFELKGQFERLVNYRSAQMALTVVILAGIGVCLRGRIGTRPMQRVDCGVTSHRLLNLGTLNPVYNLKSAWRAGSRSSDYFDDGRLLSEQQLVVHVDEIANVTGFDASRNLNSSLSPANFEFPAWQRVAEGPPIKRPSHVFVLFIESYDSWPFMEKYRELGLVEQGRQLGKEGHLLRTFLPGANSSVRSSLVCLQGLFDTNRRKQECMPTSLVAVMEKLGYQSRSVNSFTSEWGDAQRMAEEQGFDKIYCTAEIKPGGETNNLQIHDRTLYEFAADKLNYDQPTFNFIRSSSYHGPYEVDIESEGCEIEPFPESIRQPGMLEEDGLRLAYGHLKYSDKMAVEFVRKMIQRYPDSLFVLTGDHYGRRFLTTDIPIYEGSSVPLILYGPNVLQGTELPKGMAASHVDMVTTLVELCAPQGFEYTSVGKSVLKPCDDPVGVGENYVIFPEAVVTLLEPAECTELPWLKEKVSLSQSEKEDLIAQARKIYEAYYGVGYMLARKSLESAPTRIASRPGRSQSR